MRYDDCMKVALITGITGQDGSYLCEFLLDRGYEVHGIRRRTSLFNTQRIDHLYNDSEVHEKRLFLHDGDMTDSMGLFRIVQSVKPDEIYNLAAQSHVGASFETPEYTANVDALGTLRLLEAVRQSARADQIRLYNASTSELFGNSPSPQNEMTSFCPESPYAVAKLYAHWMVINYRRSYGLFASNGILFNHESPRRGPTFVSQKIIRGLNSLVNMNGEAIRLGNLDAKRDWGHAREYVEIMWQILQHDEALDIVVATGRQKSVREFVELAAGEYQLEIHWEGVGSDERGIDQKGRTVVVVDKEYYRPRDVSNLLGDPSLARKLLGWSPKIELEELIKEMVLAEVGLLK